MKILFTNFHHRNGGGHVTYIVNLLKGLGPDHDMTVATPGTSRLYRYAQQLPGVRVVDQCYTSRVFQLIPEVLRLRRLIRRERYDIVHVNASADHRHVMLACLGLRRRPKIIWTKHNDHPVDSFGHALRARLGTDLVIAVSDFVQRLLDRSAYRNLPRHVVRHGVDTDYFSPPGAVEKSMLRQRLPVTQDDDSIVLGSSGGTDYDKGWLDLLAALAQLPPLRRQRFRVVVAGDLPDEAKRKRVDDLGVAELVAFPGLLDDVRPVLGACDVGFVLSYREALSFAARETLSLGLPTLVSDAGGLPENVDDGVDGWVVPARDSAAIARVLQALLDHPERLPAMGLAAREKSEREFGLALFTRRTLALYEQALA